MNSIFQIIYLIEKIEIKEIQVGTYRVHLESTEAKKNTDVQL